MTRTDMILAADQRWCILRTSAGRTLLLTQSLAAAGFDVWTPSERVLRRKPRTKVQAERLGPIMPTFVFARAAHLQALVDEVADPETDHPQFSVFRFNGRIPLLSDTEIVRLREVEQQRNRPARPSPSQCMPRQVGERIRMTSGGFEGMTGIVKRSDGRYTLVGFGGSLDVKIDTFLIQSDDVTNVQPLVGTAVQAA